MTLQNWIMISFCLILCLVQAASLFVAWWRLRHRVARRSSDTPLPFIALVRPLCGKDAFEEETLRSSFLQNYPAYEILFCVASPYDPVIPLVKKVMADYPAQPARLLTGEDRISKNPKINNLNKAWQQTCSDWIVMADSNLLLPSHYLRTLVNSFDDQTGLVSSPAVGIRPLNLWGRWKRQCLIHIRHDGSCLPISRTRDLRKARRFSGVVMCWSRAADWRH